MEILNFLGTVVLDVTVVGNSLEIADRDSSIFPRLDRGASWIGSLIRHYQYMPGASCSICEMCQSMCRLESHSKSELPLPKALPHFEIPILGALSLHDRRGRSLSVLEPGNRVEQCVLRL
jgi:hypothetical protein